MIVRSTFVETLKLCKMKAYLKYIEGLYPPVKGEQSPDLFFGKALHDALKTLHDLSHQDAISHIDSLTFPYHLQKTKEICKALLNMYAKDNPIEIIVPEREFSFKIGRHEWKGRFDAIGKFKGELFVVEHKTTKPFYLKDKPNDQFIGYYLGGKVHSDDVSGTIINSFDVSKLKLRRIPVRFSREEVDDWISEMKMEISNFQRCITANVFPKTPSACYSYGRECEYFPLCSDPSSFDVIKEKCFKVSDDQINLRW